MKVFGFMLAAVMTFSSYANAADECRRYRLPAPDDNEVSVITLTDGGAIVSQEWGETPLTCNAGTCTGTDPIEGNVKFEISGEVAGKFVFVGGEKWQAVCN